jgi:tetratricopeptide (TPR) repeat protein
MRRTGDLIWLGMVFFLSACASFQTAGQVQSGRRALLVNDSEQALAYFQEAAKSNPDYVFEAVRFREGVWTYVGRAQYATGRLHEARQSLERALSIYPDDNLARIYLGLTLIRSEDGSRGLKELESGMRDLHGWLEYMTASRPFGPFWDPVREIRKELENDLAMLSTKDIEWKKLIESGEWIGQKMEDEIDKVRRDELEQFRRRDFDSRSGVSLGIGLGF